MPVLIQKNKNYITKLDTIKLKKSFNTCYELQDIIDNKDFIINKDCFIKYSSKPKELKNDNYLKREFLELKQSVKDEIYGLEKLYIYQSYITDSVDKKIKTYVPIMCLVFNSKLLHNDYLKSINKNNIDMALNNLITPLSNIIKLSNRFILNNFQVYQIDFTDNLKIKNYEIKDCIKAISYNSNIIDNKKIYNDYDTTLSYKMPYKTRFLFYDKHIEIKDTIKAVKDSVNKRFFNKYSDLIANSSGIFRIERRLNKKQLYKYLNTPKTEKITLNKILNSSVNINYFELEKITKNKAKKMIETKLQIKNKKDLNDYVINYFLYNYFNYDLNKIKDLIFALPCYSLQSKYKLFDKYKSIIKKYKNKNKKDKQVDYIKLLNHIKNKLKTA